MTSSEEYARQMTNKQLKKIISLKTKDLDYWAEKKNYVAVNLHYNLLTIYKEEYKNRGLNMEELE